MKIVNIIPSYYPHPKGGSAYSQYRLNSSLCKNNGIKVFSFGPKRQEYQIEDNHVVYFGNLISFTWTSTIYKSIKESDLVWVSSFFFSLNILIILLCKVYRKPIIVSPRGEFFKSAIEKQESVLFDETDSQQDEEKITYANR